jgi:nucleotide-binding universal stress UspA family protein
MPAFEPKYILCPVDFSQASAATLRVAAAFARAFGSELAVLHAQPVDVPPYFTVAQTREIRANFRRSLSAGRQYLEDFANTNLPKATKRSYRLLAGPPVETILRSADSGEAGLIVMGTHGRTGWSKFRLGSVMEGVLRQAGAPVLVIGPQAAKRRPPFTLRQILCPTSLDAVSGDMLQVAASIAGRTGAKVLALHVLEAGGLASASSAAARQQLCDWLAPEVRETCSIREVIREGRPGEQIALEAKTAAADLIVIGGQQRHRIAPMLFGSTTEYLIRNAPCPVLVVKRDRGPGRRGR